MTSRVILDPTSEKKVGSRELLTRPASISGQTIGLLDISKARGDVFLNQLESRLTVAGAKVLRFRKPTFTKPSPVDLRHEISTKCTLVIEALADWGSCTSCSVHDIVDFETRGVPAMFIASDGFIEAAESQANALGFPTVQRVFVPHPIQDRTDDEIRVLADSAFDSICNALTAKR